MTQPMTAADIWGEESSDAYQFRKLGENRYTLDLGCLSTTFEVDRLRRERGELRAELTVHCALNGARTFRGVLSSGETNLSSTEARKRLANSLAGQAKNDPGEWLAALERLHILVREAERTGDPALLLRDVPRPSPDDSFEVDGVKLLKRHPMILFGDGGSLKSYLALYMAGKLEQAGIRVGLFDWELSAEDHRDRIERLFGESYPNLVYVRCTRALPYEVDRLARIKHEQGLQYAIFDSIAFACGGAPEAAEVAGDYFRAVRSIDVGSLHIAHVTKNLETGDQRPFGSAFWHNGARSTWFVKQAEASPDNRIVTVGLFQRKTNMGPLQRAIGFRATFDGGSTRIARVNLAEVESLAGRLPTWQRVVTALKTGSMTYAQLAQETDSPEDTIRKEVTRKAKGDNPLFTVIEGGDGVQRIGLVKRFG